MKTIATTFFLFLILLVLPLFAWERVYSNPNYESVSFITPAFDGGYILSGSSKPSRTSIYEDALLIKIDNVGDVVWSELHGGLIAREKSKGIVSSADSTYVVALSIDFPSLHAGLLKLDSYGDTLWSKAYNLGFEHAPFDFIETRDGGYVLCGWVNFISTDLNAQLLFIIRADSDGDTLWTRFYGNGTYNHAYAIRQTSDNGFLICGETRKTSFPYDEDIYIVKISEDGDSIWARTYDVSGSGYYDGAQSMFLMEGDTAIITGFADWATGSGHPRFCVMCVDETGELLWHNIIGPIDTYSGGIKIIRSPDSGFIVLGQSFSPATMSFDVWLLKLDEHGDTLWTRKFGEETDKSEYGFDILETEDGGYIIAGCRVYLDTDIADPLVIRVDSLGHHVPAAISENPPAPKPEAFEISAYPNPFNSAVTITLDCHSREIGNPDNPIVEIYDVAGRLVANTPFGTARGAAFGSLSRVETTFADNSIRLHSESEYIWHPAPSLGSGVYLIRALSGDGNVATKRVVYLK